jgi:hypothetical protein
VPRSERVGGSVVSRGLISANTNFGQPVRGEHSINNSVATISSIATFIDIKTSCGIGTCVISGFHVVADGARTLFDVVPDVVPVGLVAIRGLGFYA